MTAPRAENNESQERFTLLLPFASAAADATTKVFRASRSMRIDTAYLVVPAGLAEDGTNFVIVKLQHGTGPTVAYSRSSKTVAGGGQGTFTANTFLAMVKAAEPAPVVPAGAEVAIFTDENGDTTMPAGFIQIEGRYL
jgi:hypothetical protein